MVGQECVHLGVDPGEDLLVARVVLDRIAPEAARALLPFVGRADPDPVLAHRLVLAEEEATLPLDPEGGLARLPRLQLRDQHLAAEDPAAVRDP